MRGNEEKQHEIFSYVNMEERIPGKHPLRPMKTMVDELLKGTI